MSHSEPLLAVAFDEGGDYQLVPVETNGVQEAIVPVVLWDGVELRCHGTAFAISASGLFVTARHVVNDFLEQFAEATLHGQAGLFILYESNYPLPPTEDEPDVPASFGGLFPVLGVAQHPTADLAVLRVAVPRRNGQPVRFPTLGVHVGLPRVGQLCTAIGYGYMKLGEQIGTKASKSTSLTIVDYERQLAVSRGDVVAVHPVRRDLGLLNWPCFQSRARFAGGMSGAPVITEYGVVVGAVCTCTNEAPWTSTVTLLGALMVLHVPPVDDKGHIGRGLVELAEEGAISVTGMDEIADVEPDAKLPVYSREAIARAQAQS